MAIVKFQDLMAEAERGGQVCHFGDAAALASCRTVVPALPATSANGVQLFWFSAVRYSNR